MNVYFGDTDLTRNGIPKNMQKFMKAGNNHIKIVDSRLHFLFSLFTLFYFSFLFYF